MLRKDLLHILFCLVFFSSCVHYGFKGITIPPEAKTISVGFFQNRAALANPSEAQKFTERLRDMVSSQTNLALTKENGDLQFEGFIADYNVVPVSIQSTDAAALNRLTITVNVKYSNRFDASKNFEQSFSRFSDYKSTATLSSVEVGLMEDINKQLTEDVFNKAFNNW
ncbi:MAG: LptE family protein [Bacteroidia bacterium]